MTNDEPINERIAQLIEEIRRGVESNPNWIHSADAENVEDELADIGEPAVPALIAALDSAEPIERILLVTALGKFGEPALEALTKALDDEFSSVRDMAVQGLNKIGKPALEALTKALTDNNSTYTHAAAIQGLGKIGEPSLDVLSSVLGTNEPRVQNAILQALSQIGEPTLSFLSQALVDEDVKVRLMATKGLGTIGEPALSFLSQALVDEDVEVRLTATKGLGTIGEPAMDVLSYALQDKNGTVRFHAIDGLYGIGKPALHHLVVAIEDPSGRLSKNVISRLTGQEGKQFETSEVIEAIIEGLIVRSSKQPSEHFNPDRIIDALDTIMMIHPRLHSQILKRLCDLAYQHDKKVRKRVTSVARGLNTGEFAALVKDKTEENPDAANAIMSMLGGGEAAAFFSELQGKALRDYREPLVDLEDMSRERWNELTQLARRSYNASLWLGTGLFIVGVIIIFVGLGLLIFSRDNWQQIGGSLMSVLTAMAAMASQFWKEPVVNIQEFFAKQARLQATFIGYMNRVAQLRLVFEDHYAKGEVTLDDLEIYQRGLS